ncbi:DUF2147 domain-containing protein [Spongiivirga citrea]|uniref:DUF2147 domain-containing protein n=1 Tax=Spongiivirga citrea TaxID=1481457 RepID=A0A6M0CQ49_9FLAO|nr:DUF2147 domain-containing protein [Spongiivirga citrea]NER17627.1 DUF2147 domain-containing protein [Spongiivirga citrea]
MKKLLVVTLLLVSTATLTAQSVMGKWKSIDDETGEAKSIVEIYEDGGRIYGKIVEILNPDRKDVLCEKCEGDEKDKPILGLTIIKNLKKNGEEYKGGTIFDPQKGKQYKCKIWVDEDDTNKLNVRGYIAFLYRTQNWYRVK